MKNLLFLMTIFFLIPLLAFLLLAHLFVTNYSWDRDIWNQEKIATAYVAYFKDKRLFPEFLEKLVNTGYLPRESNFYVEPPGWYWQGRPIYGYQQSSYLIFKPQDGKVECLCMIARRYYINGEEKIRFEPMINAEVRDKILSLQRP